jgi:WD40 repeat protein
MYQRTCANLLAIVALTSVLSLSSGNAVPAPARAVRSASQPRDSKIDLRVRCRGDINSIAFSPNGRSLAVAVELKKSRLVNETEVVFYDSRSGRVQQKFVVPGAVYDLEYSPDGKSLLFNQLQYPDGVAENSLQVWELATRRRRKVSNSADESLIAPNGKLMATAGDQIRLFSLPSWKPGRVFTMPFKGDPFGAAFSPDSRYLAMLHASVDGLDTDLHIVDIRTGKVVAAWGGDDRSQDMLGPPFAFVDAAPFSRRDRPTSLIFRGNLVQFRWKGGKWVVSDSKSLLPAKNGVVEALSVGKRTLVVFTDLEGRRILWDCGQRRVLRTWTKQAPTTQDAVFSPNQAMLALVNNRDLLISSLASSR